MLLNVVENEPSQIELLAMYLATEIKVLCLVTGADLRVCPPGTSVFGAVMEIDPSSAAGWVLEFVCDGTLINDTSVSDETLSGLIGELLREVDLFGTLYRTEGVPGSLDGVEEFTLELSAAGPAPEGD